MQELKDTYTTKRVYVKFVRNAVKVYRIIPHADVGSNNKRLWRALYKMFEMYNSPLSRLERDGFKFTLREKDVFWFDILFRQKDGRKSVEFYMATSEFQAEKLKRKIENKMNVTVKEASIEDLQVPDTQTTVQELSYLKHDIFSLNTNTNDAKTPIANILSVVDELQHDGDIARLSVCSEAENRNKWVKNAQWAYEKVNQGKTPQRATVNGKVFTNYAKSFVAYAVNEINDLFADILQALQNSFYKSDKKIKKQDVLKHTIAEDIGTTKVSREKGNLPVFRSHIRVAAHSSDKLTRDTLSESLALSVQDLSDTNELHGVKVTNKQKKKRVIEELNTLSLSPVTRTHPNVNLISTDEMSKLALMMPPKELQRKYADVLDIKQRPEVTIPLAMQDPDGLYLGKAQLKDTEIDIYMPVDNPDNLYRAYTFIGGQGGGKDTAMKNLITEGNLKHNISYIVIDAILEPGERGMADGIRDALPPDRIIDLNMNDDDYIPPMDLTEVISTLGRNGASRFADEMIDFMQLEGLNRSEKYLTDAAKASGGNLFNIKRIIEDEDYRVDRATQLMNEGNLRLSKELTRWGTNADIGNKCDAVLHRLNRFFGNERLYDIFAQDPLPELDFRKWMSEGKVIIIRVPNGRGLGEHATKTLVHWITLKAFMTRMLMSKEEQANGCFIVFNEPEQYQSEGLTKLMGRIGTEGRKERLGSLYAFHHWNKLAPSLQENLQGGGVQQFLFMNDHTKTFDLSRHRFEETIPLEDAYKLPARHAIISVRAKNELQPAFICKMAAPPKTLYDNSFLTLRHARMYGRSWAELQKAL